MNNSRWKQRKKSVFSIGFRRSRIEKRKSLFRRQENNFPLSAFSQILLSPFYCFSQVFAPYILGDYLLSLQFRKDILSIMHDPCQHSHKVSMPVRDLKVINFPRLIRELYIFYFDIFLVSALYPVACLQISASFQPFSVRKGCLLAIRHLCILICVLWGGRKNAGAASLSHIIRAFLTIYSN